MPQPPWWHRTGAVRDSRQVGKSCRRFSRSRYPRLLWSAHTSSNVSPSGFASLATVSPRASRAPRSTLLMVVTDTPLFSASSSTVSPLSSLIRRSSRPNHSSLTPRPSSKPPRGPPGLALARSCRSSHQPPQEVRGGQCTTKEGCCPHPRKPPLLILDADGRHYRTTQGKDAHHHKPRERVHARS